jgi:hypothetical protein
MSLSTPVVQKRPAKRLIKKLLFFEGEKISRSTHRAAALSSAL